MLKGLAIGIVFCTLQYQNISKKASCVSRKFGFHCRFPVGDGAYCKMHGMTVVWEREWMTWGKMARQALQACVQKCGLILHFLLPGPLPSSLQVPFSEKVRRVCCTHGISHGTLWEDNPCTLSKSVCLLNEEPPSTSSPSNHFGLNPVEMSKSCREQKGLTHRALYAAGAQAEV